MIAIDPKVQRNIQNEAKRAETEHTFENVAAAWFELKKDSVTPSVRRGHLAVAHTACIPDLKTTPLSKISLCK